MLADTQCRNAKPKEKPSKLTDGKGLYLEVKPNGVKAWRYRFELREGVVVQESLFAIGDYVVAPRPRKRHRRVMPAAALRWPKQEKSASGTWTRKAGHQSGP